MKRASILSIAIWFFAIPSHAEPIATPSDISEVTVFPDRALITRIATAELPAGPNTLVIPDLPHGLDVDSVRVSATGNAPFTIVNFEIRQQFTEHLVSDEEQRLTDRLQVLKDQRRGLSDSIAALNDQLTFIRNIGRQVSDTITRTLPQGEIAPERWQQSWLAVGEGIAATHRDIQQAQMEQRQLDQKIKKTEQELNLIRTGRRESRAAHITVSAPQTTRAQLKLQYQVFSVSWSAQYDARLDSHTRRTALTQLATVRQRSGEPWHNVTLRISTARPSGRVAPPELPPWFIDFDRPAPMPRQRVQSPAAMKSLADGMVLEAEIAAEPVLAQAQVSEFAAFFVIPGKVTVPSDGEPHRFVIAEHSLESTIALRSVPKLDPTAFVFTETVYTGAAPLTAGTLNLFRDGAYIGRGRLPQTRPQQTIKLALGADDRVKIEYALETGQRSSEGMFNQKRRVERHYRIDLENYHQQPMTLTVLDQLPVPQDERIKVELLRNATAPTERDVDGQKGVIAWTRKLAAGEKSTLRFSYAVSFPEDQQVPGF